MAVEMQQSHTQEDQSPLLPKKIQANWIYTSRLDSLWKWALDAAAWAGESFLTPPFNAGRLSLKPRMLHPNCRPILFDETHSGFENPSSTHLRMVGNTMGSQQDEPTWEIPFLKSVSGTGPGTDASRFGRIW